MHFGQVAGATRGVPARRAQKLAQPSTAEHETEQSAAPPQLTLQLPVHSVILQVVAPMHESEQSLPGQLSSQVGVLTQARSQLPPAQVCLHEVPPVHWRSHMPPVQVWVQSPLSVHWRSHALPWQV